MANLKTTEENPATTPLSGAEILRAVQGGLNVRLTAQDVADLAKPSLTAGSVLFASATDTIGEDNADFFWDNINKTLKLKNALAAPGGLYVEGTAHGAGVTLNYAGSAASLTDQGSFVEFQLGGAQVGDIGVNNAAYPSSGILGPNDFTIQAWTGNLDLATRAAKDIIFATNGVTNERVRFDSAGGVSIGKGSAADSKSLLDMVSTTKGVLWPRMTTTQRDAITSPPTGLQIFNTTTATPQYYNGSAWVSATTTSPGGSSGQIQYNSSGAFAGSSSLTFDSAFTSGNGVTLSRGTGGACLLLANNTGSGTGDYSGFHTGIGGGTDIAYLTSTGSGFTPSGIFIASASFCYGTQSGGFWVGAAGAGAKLGFFTGGSATTNERASIDGNGNVIVGRAALATNATNGFFYIPTCAGAPTGTPTSVTGRVPMIFDATNNNFYIYNGGGWKKTTTFA